MRWAVTVSVVTLASSVGGCALTGSVHGLEKGDCVRKDGEVSFVPASCSSSDAGFVVLDRVASGGTENECVNVAGTEYVQVNADGSSVCVGTRGADTAHAPNAAKVGDCLTADRGDAHKVDCADPAAAYRILARRSSTGASPAADCQRVPGTRTTYDYILRSETGIGSIGTGIVFCLAPATA